MRNLIAHVGPRIRRALSRLSVLSWLALIVALGTVIGLAVAASVSDSFTDTTKIASNVNLTVDT
ncbi:hypothetical protein HYW11_00670, partial [Candidatus Peregrinibacteria bacterium]|nr:hypothetical protein [Candidatus Peregrinibacteria bacterium]